MAALRPLSLPVSVAIADSVSIDIGSIDLPIELTAGDKERWTLSLDQADLCSRLADLLRAAADTLQQPCEPAPPG